MHAAAVLRSPDLVHAVCQFQCGTYRDLIPICRLPWYIQLDNFNKSIVPVLSPWFAEYGTTRLPLLARHVPRPTLETVAMYAVQGGLLDVVQCLHEQFNAVVTTPELDVAAAARNRLDVLEFLFDIQYPVEYGQAVLSAVTPGHFSAAEVLVAHAPPCLSLDNDWSDTLVNLVATKQWALVDRLLPKFTREGAVFVLAAAVACGDLDRAVALQSEYGVADDLAVDGRGYLHAAMKCSLRGLKWIFSNWSAQISDRERQDAECAYFQTAVTFNPHVDVVSWLADRVVCTNYETLEALALDLTRVHPNHVRTIIAHVCTHGEHRFNGWRLVNLAGDGRLDFFQPMVDSLAPSLSSYTLTTCMIRAIDKSRLDVLQWLMSSGHLDPDDTQDTLNYLNHREDTSGTNGDYAMLLAFRAGRTDLVVSLHDMGAHAEPVVFEFSHDKTNGVLRWLCTGVIPQPPSPAIETTNVIDDAPAIDGAHHALACVQHLVASRGGRANFLGEFLVEITRHSRPKHLFRRVHRAWRRLVPPTSPDRATIHQRCWDEAVVHHRPDILARLVATGTLVSEQNLVMAGEYGHIGLVRAILEATTCTPHGGLVDECRAVARARGHAHVENFLRVWPNLGRRARPVV